MAMKFLSFKLRFSSYAFLEQHTRCNEGRVVPATLQVGERWIVVAPLCLFNGLSQDAAGDLED